MSENVSSFITSNELEIFTVPSFEERMNLIRERVSPKLGFLGEQISVKIKERTGYDLYPQVAKHARRTVNPPDETWVALSPAPRGYKMHVHLEVGVGYYGSFVRCSAKAESNEKALLAEAIANFGSNRNIWIIKGENPVVANKDSVLEVVDFKSYGIETGLVIDGVPGSTLHEWLSWSLSEIDAIWNLYEYVRKRV